MTTGWNRYYGLNAFFNELQDRKDLYKTKKYEIMPMKHRFMIILDAQNQISILSRSRISTPIELKNTLQYLCLATDYTDTTRNFTDYTTSYNGTSEVYYAGKLMNARDFSIQLQYPMYSTPRMGYPIQ
ncbi:hypothetical protein [Acinetobacter sp.]|uniref:hypothetical protein n=1 Tax=Acinetobacter sp. TaxID=472 RepID=UPI00388F47D1